MKNINKSLDNYAKELNNHQLLEYEYLPDIELYMEQMTMFLDRLFALYKVSSDEPLITSAMVNNYVRGQVIDKPNLKKYNKEHLSKIIEIAILKQMLEIDDIKELLDTKYVKKKYGQAYNNFANRFNDELQAETKKMRQSLKKVEDNDLKGIYEIATEFAIKGAICSMISKRIFNYIHIYQDTKDL